MLLERKQDLSIYYFLTDLFSATPFIKIVDGFPVDNLVVPSVAVEAKTIDTRKFELGGKTRLKLRAWYIDVFATNKSQRDEIAYSILDALEECIPVYDYDEGFPPSVNPTQIGCLEVGSLRMEIIRVMPQFVDKLYWRSVVSFTARYQNF